MHTQATTAEAKAARPTGSALALLFALALCYANGLSGPFLFDDPLPGTALTFRARPLVWASFELNRALSGAETWSYHLLNVALHGLCALTLLGVLRRALALALPREPERARASLTLAVTLLWLCHPLQTASVTYLSQRAEILATLGYLGTLYGFLRALEPSAPRRWQALALASLAFGFLAKEIAATAPLLVLLAELTLVPGPLAANLRRRAGFHLLLWLEAGALFLVYVAPHLFASDSSSGFGAHQSFGPLAYLRSQPGVLLHYLRLAFWPHPLVFDYGWPVASALADWLPQTLALGALLSVTLVLLARRAALGLALAAFFVVLAPSSSLVPIKDLAFEHRMYLALAPVLLVVALGVRRACRRVPRLAGSLCGLALVGLAAATVQRNRDYRSAVALWSTVVARAPANGRAHNNLASALIDEERMAEAEDELARAKALTPDSSFVYRNLARIAAWRGQLEQAIALLERALALQDAAATRADLALLLRSTGRGPESEPHLVRALELEPERVGERLELARLLLARGQREAAMAQLVRAAERRADPRRAEVLETLADVHLELGQHEAARSALARALALPEASRDPARAARLQARLEALGPRR